MPQSKFWSTLQNIDHPWSSVATYFWSRYPNPNSSHVFSEDTIEVGVDREGKLRTKRLIVKTNKLPWWGKHLFSARKVALVEESVVDPKCHKMVTYTRNIGLRLFMGTTERVEYTKAAENPDLSTSCLKQVWIESDLMGLRSAIRKFGVDRFRANCVLATEGLVWAIENDQKRTGDPPTAESPKAKHHSTPTGSPAANLIGHQLSN